VKAPASHQIISPDPMILELSPVVSDEIYCELIQIAFLPLALRHASLAVVATSQIFRKF
jgi:hypothetical protein